MQQFDPNEHPPLKARRLTPEPGHRGVSYAFRIPRTLHQTLRKYAKDTEVPLSYAVRKLLTEGLESRGYAVRLLEPLDVRG